MFRFQDGKPRCFIKKLEHYLDTDGCVFHLDDNLSPEYGDGMARYSSLKLCEYMLAPTMIDASIVKHEFNKTSKKSFFLSSGEPVRRVTPMSDNQPWYSREGTCSGDQIIPYLCACLVMGLMPEFWDMILKLLKRGFFAWNTKHIGQQDEKTKVPDFVFFRVFGLILRGLYTLPFFGYLFYPVIALWDLFLCFTTLVRCIKPLIDRDDTGDDLNYFHSLIAYFKIAPTPISWMCRNFYYAFRPLSGTPEYRKQNKGTLGCISAFENYYEGIKNPPLNVPLKKVALIL